MQCNAVQDPFCLDGPYRRMDGPVICIELDRLDILRLYMVFIWSLYGLHITFISSSYAFILDQEQ